MGGEVTTLGSGLWKDIELEWNSEEGEGVERGGGVGTTSNRVPKIEI